MPDIDIKMPLENPKLKELFLQLGQLHDQSECAATMGRLAEEIVMNAHFLSVIQLSEEPEPQSDGNAIFRKDSTISFSTIASQDGKSFFPVFIDWEELWKWDSMRNAQPKTLIMCFDDLAAMVLNHNNGDGIVIDPFSHNLLLDRDTLTRWCANKQLAKTGHTEQRIEKDTAVRLGTPKDYPDAMVHAICEYARKNRDVQTLWLRLMEKGGELSYLVVAEFKGDRSVTFGHIAKVGKPYLGGMYLDMVPYEDGFGRQAVEGVAPFYRKKRGFFGA